MGVFLKDSVKIGEPVLYSLSIEYPIDADVVFPDSLFNFSPFELNQKDYFFTRSDYSFSFDSAIYNLSTFEIDSVQFLRLPVFLILDNDSLTLRPDIDSIVLNHVVTQMPDSLAFLENTVYRETVLQFNYPYLIAGIIVLVVLSILIYLIFGKQIKRNIILYRLKRAHIRFVENFNPFLKDNQTNPESVLVIWKTYMEKLEGFPYTKSTTKEIALIEANIKAMKPLKLIDRAIYGKFEDSTLPSSYQDLLSFTDQKYQAKVEFIKYGAGDR